MIRWVPERKYFRLVDCNFDRKLCTCTLYALKISVFMLHVLVPVIKK
jgi:hypothetical protein